MTTETDAPAPEQQHRGIPADSFRARLRLARMHAGDLTMREAAERCGLNHASWANWEKGMEPRGLVEIVDAISRGLLVDRDWLLFGGPLALEQRRTGRVLARKPGRTILQHNPTGRPIPPRSGGQSTRPTPRVDATAGPHPAGPRTTRTRRVTRPDA